MLAHIRSAVVDYFKSHIVAYFFLMLIFVIGIVVGALAVKTLPDEQKTELISYLRLFFQGLTQEGYVQEGSMLETALFNNAKTICLLWILGFTVIGIPFVFFIIFTRGFVIGFTVGFLVNEYVMKGLAFAFASVLPHNFLAVPALLTAGVAAVSFSLSLIRRAKSRNGFFKQAVTYTLILFFTLLLMTIAGCVEVIVSPVFMKLVARILVK